MKEKWKDIEGYEGLYQVSNLGRVKSLGRKKNVFNKGVYNIPAKIMKTDRPNSATGYIEINLNKDGKTKGVLVHRLVAKAFIDNPLQKPEVNHKDGNRINNAVDNLEWVTSSENNKHKFAVLGFKQKPRNCKPILCVETGIKYPSIIEASRASKISRRAIQFCLKGETKTSGGFHWRYS